MAVKMPASAAGRVAAVYLSLVSDDDYYDLTPGTSADGMIPSETDDDYYIFSYDVSYLNSGVIAYTLDIQASSGCSFDENTMVSVYGAYDVSVSLRTLTHLRVTARMYPLQVLAETRPVIDVGAKNATWAPVDGAKSYSVIICYMDNRGYTHRVTKSVKGTSVDLSNYVGRYEEVDVAVRPEKGTGTRSRYVAVPNYVSAYGTLYDEDYYMDSYEFNLPTATYGSVSGGTYVQNPYNSGVVSGNPLPSGPLGSQTGGTANSTSGGGPLGVGSSPAVSAGSWMGSGDLWYYVRNGSPVTGWLSLTSDEWYYMDPATGYMKAGWFSDGTSVYLLNPNHDGTYGKMLTGYQTVSGLTYYFNELHDGTYGAMYRSRYTPQGRWADENGIVH